MIQDNKLAFGQMSKLMISKLKNGLDHIVKHFKTCSKGENTTNI